MDKIDIYQDGNTLILNTLDPAVLRPVQAELSFNERIWKTGQEYARAKRAKQMLFDLKRWDVFAMDAYGRLMTQAGFLPRIIKLLRASGFVANLIDVTPARDTDPFRADWSRVHESIRWKHRQKELVECIIKLDRGQLVAPTGMGKGFVIGQAASILHNAKILVATYNTTVLCTRLYPEIKKYVTQVGVQCSKMRRPGKRVFCWGVDSLNTAPSDFDVVIVDEGHEVAGDRRSAFFSKFKYAKMFMLTASPVRGDGKELRLEAIFGPIVYEMSYTEAVLNKLIVPIKVKWTHCLFDENPADGYVQRVARERHGIWLHKARNELIAKDARSYGPDVQVLVHTTRLVHALALKKLLPEFELIFSDSRVDEEEANYMRNEKIAPPDFRAMTWAERMRITEEFSTRKIKKCICTTVWNAGVDFPELAVLVRAGGGSAVSDVQVPGRASRTGEGTKEFAIVHDYLDQFDKGFKSDARRRFKNYAGQEWEQEIPPKLKGQYLMLDEDDEPIY